MIEVGVPADGAREVAVTGIRQLPDQIAVLPLRETVTFPEMPVPLNIGQARSIELVNDALRGDRSIVLVAGRDPEVEAPGPDQLYSVGVLGTIARMIRLPDDSLRVLVQGGQRVRVSAGFRPSPTSSPRSRRPPTSSARASSCSR